MLGKLLELLEENPNQLTQDQICIRLGVSPQSLQAIMEILVRKGRLSTQMPQKESGCATLCRDCPALSTCSQNEDHRETFYRVESIT